MYREIVHRGRKKGSKKWLIGHAYDCTKSKGYISYSKYSFCKDRDEVVPNTIGMFSGFYDIERTPIFEGDVIITPGFISEGPGIWIVMYDEENHRLRLSDGETGWYDIEIRALRPGSFRVIGNIHDNPEWEDLNFHNLILHDKNLFVTLGVGNYLSDKEMRIYNSYIKRARRKTTLERKLARFQRENIMNKEVLKSTDEELPF